MTKPVTGLTVFGSNTTGTTTQLDNNFIACTTALNDLNTYGNFLTDTGAANALAVTLPANITGALTNGLPIQVKVAANNSGATVLNYNATGNANVINLDGSALSANQLQANSIVLMQYSSGSAGWILQTPAQAPSSNVTNSTFTFDGSGGTSASKAITAQKTGSFVTLNVPSVTATSGTGSTKLSSNTALPAAYRPAVLQVFTVNQMVNNGAVLAAPGLLIINTSGVIDILRDAVPTAFTNTASGGTNAAQSALYFTG